MKKITTTLLGLLFLVVSCSKQDSKVALEEQEQESIPKISSRYCASQEVLEEQMAADPTLKIRMQNIEEFTTKFSKNPRAYRLVNGVITIPVVVHVLYKTDAENISAAQIQSQIDVLNEDFNNTNADRIKVPLEFQDEQTTVGIKFELAQVIRKATNKKSWTTNDAMKKTAQGGSDPISPATTLNMWACNLGNGLLGYAQFPGGPASTDGVVVLYSAFGRTGTLIPSFNLGRTATHEVGHYLNLRHIWGDATCGTDQVPDTPPHNTANYGCPAYPHKSTCTGNPTEMTMNYMDYTDDACMYMFSHGQNTRMKAVFASGGPRATLAQ
jgi:hypothetical protein